MHSSIHNQYLDKAHRERYQMASDAEYNTVITPMREELERLVQSRDITDAQIASAIDQLGEEIENHIQANKDSRAENMRIVDDLEEEIHLKTQQQERQCCPPLDMSKLLNDLNAQQLVIVNASKELVKLNSDSKEYRSMKEYINGLEYNMHKLAEDADTHNRNRPDIPDDAGIGKLRILEAEQNQLKEERLKALDEQDEIIDKIRKNIIN